MVDDPAVAEHLVVNIAAPPVAARRRAARGRCRPRREGPPPACAAPDQGAGRATRPRPLTKDSRTAKKNAQPRGEGLGVESAFARGAGREAGTAGGVVRLDGGHYRYRVTPPDQLDLSASQISSIEPGAEFHKNVTGYAQVFPSSGVAKSPNSHSGIFRAYRGLPIGRPDRLDHEQTAVQIDAFRQVRDLDPGLQTLRIPGHPLLELRGRALWSGTAGSAPGCRGPCPPDR